MRERERGGERLTTASISEQGVAGGDHESDNDAVK